MRIQLIQVIHYRWAKVISSCKCNIKIALKIKHCIFIDFVLIKPCEQNTSNQIAQSNLQSHQNQKTVNLRDPKGEKKLRHLEAREVGTWDWVTNGCQDRVLRSRLVWCFFATLHKIKHMVQRTSYGTGFSVPQLYPAILSIFFVLSTHHFHTYTHTSTRIIIEYSFSSWPGLWLGTGFVLSMRHWNLCCSNMSLVGCRMFF